MNSKQERMYKLALVGATGVVRKDSKGGIRRKEITNFRIYFFLFL